ncbi:MAG: EAL domain-containing protein [Gammaproteobacteria bacterium]
METLVRWRHPREGLVFPDRFVATAEWGLIDELARAALIGALRQARLWQDAGLDLKVAVNLSMDNLGALDLPDFVMRAARDAQVSPTKLVLKVTESRLTKDPVAPLDILTRLRLKGVGLSTTSARGTPRSHSFATSPSTNSKWIGVLSTVPGAMRPQGQPMRGQTARSRAGNASDVSRPRLRRFAAKTELWCRGN